MEANREQIGGNNPPGQIEFSRETVAALSEWMKEHPVIQSTDEAREAKLLCDRAAACVADMRDERDSFVRPLNEQITAINDRYRAPHQLLSGTLVELKSRLNAFILKEEQKRQQEAREAEAKLQEAARLAAEAEEAQRKAREEAKHGVLDTDIGAVLERANDTEDALRAARLAAARAQRATKVKVGGGFRRAASLRTQETLIVEDVHEAIRAMGVTDAIRDTVLTEARIFRKTFGHLPEGITSEKTRG